MSDKLRFGEILVRAGALERSQLDSILREQDAVGGDLGELLVARGCIDEPTMLQAVSKALNRPIVGLDGTQPDARALQLLTREICVEHLLFPIEIERSKSGEHLHVAMANPLDVRAIKIVMQHARLRIQPLVASAREIKGAIARYYGGPVPGVDPRPAARAGVVPTPGPAASSMPAQIPAGPPPSLIGAPAASSAAPIGRAPSIPSAPSMGSAPSTPGIGRSSGSLGGGVGSQPRLPEPVRPAGPPDAMFDFAVMDLSQYDEAEAPPPPMAPPQMAPPQMAPAAPSPLFGQVPPAAPSPLFGQAPAPSAPSPLFGQTTQQPAPLFGGASSASVGGPPALDADLVDLLDNTSDDSLVQTSDLSRPAARLQTQGAQRPMGESSTSTPGFGAIRPRRDSGLLDPPRAEARPMPAQAPPLPPPVRSTGGGGGLPPLPPLPGRAPSNAPPPGPPPALGGPATSRPLPPLPPLPGGATSGNTSKPLPPLPPALRNSRPRTSDSLPSLQGGGPPLSQSRPSMPATPPALQRQPTGPIPGAQGAIPSGVIDDVGNDNELRSILERYTQALEENPDSADVLISQFVARYGARQPVRPLETLIGTLDLQIGRVGPGLGRMVLTLVRHLSERGLIDLAEFLAECREDQNVPPRQT